MRWWAKLAILGLACACRSRPDRAPTSHAAGGLALNAVPSVAPPVAAAGSASASVAAPGAPVLRITAGDLRLEHPGASSPIFSYAARARATFERDLTALAQGEDAGAPLTIREIDVTAVSWVGPLLSYREHTFTSMPDHEAHPAGETRLVTLAIDPLPKGPYAASVVKLTDFFDERAIFGALRADPRIKKSLRAMPKPKPATLAELVTALAESQPERGQEVCYSHPEDLLERFAIHHVVGEHVVVRLGLPGSALCREELTEIELFLPIPASLAEPLGQASSGRVGFVAIDKPEGLADVHLRMTSAELGRK